MTALFAPIDAQHADDRGIVAEALRLYARGFNVFPTPIACKQPYGRWGYLKTTRLNPDAFPMLFTESNIAVVCGATSGGLVVIDCDTAHSFATISRMVEASGVPHWTRNGAEGGQFWMRCRDGEIKTERTGWGEIRGRGAYSMAPPSVHPSGMIYEWLSDVEDLPAVSFADLREIGLPMTLDQPRRRLQRTEKSGALPEAANRILIERDTTNYQSHSEAEFAALLSLISAGWSDERIVAIFERLGPPHYTKNPAALREIDLPNAHLMLAKKPRHQSESVSSKLQAVRTYVKNTSWAGHSGGSDRAVMLALIDRMRMEQSLEFRASIREVAELAGVWGATARKALERLQTRGILIKAPEQDKISTANRYRFAEFILATPVKAVVGAASLRGSQDAWDVKALRKSGHAVYLDLQSNPSSSVLDIATRTGKSAPTVRAAIERLLDHGLAVECGKSGKALLYKAIAANQKVLKEIAEVCGTTGKTVRKEAVFSIERANNATKKMLSTIQWYRDRNPS